MARRNGFPRCVVIAGPNGAGKTTFAREFLTRNARILHFVNVRVRQGGHPVPREDVVRRFQRSWTNFTTIYRPLADAWMVYDNAGEPKLIDQGP